MHVYFFGPDTKSKEQIQAYGVIKTALRQADLWVSTNTEVEEIQVSAEVMAETKQSGVPLLERMDAFIIEGSTADPQVGFLLAQAIAQAKPTLYLYRRGTVPQIFQHLSQRELPKYLQAIAYTVNGLEKSVREFLEQLTGTKIRQVPRHKFTLRITDAIEEYLHFKTHNTKITKADFLREQLERWMGQDDDWQQHQRKRRRSGQ